MGDPGESNKALALSAEEARITALLHDPSPQVIRSVLDDRNLREEDVLIIANRKNLPADIFATIAGDRRWSDNYPVRLALAKNPKTPISVSLKIVRYLRIFDIAEMTRSTLLPLAFRHKVEAIVIERIPTMPLGYRKTLAKMASGAVLLKLMQDADAEVIALCLNSPHLRENHLFKTISRSDTLAGTIRMIAEHPNWAGRPLIRYALARNHHTPLVLTERFLQAMRLQELREIHADPTLMKEVRPLVYRELLSRGLEPGEQVEEKVFEIDEDDDLGMEAYEEGPDADSGLVD